jgi:hypothetical protein
MADLTSESTNRISLQRALMGRNIALSWHSGECRLTTVSPRQ